MHGKGRPFKAGDKANPHGRHGKDRVKAEAQKLEREIERK